MARERDVFWREVLRFRIRTSAKFLAFTVVLLVVLGLAASIGRVMTIAKVATPVTEARMTAARALLPAHADEIQRIEQHFTDHAPLTLVHVIAGGLFLALGLLQFSPGIRNRHLRFHRQSGRFLVALAIISGTAGLWSGVVTPYSPTERLPVAGAAAVFLISPAMAIAAIRRADIIRHREWMIRFFAVAIGIVVIRLVEPVIIWLLQPVILRDVIGLTFWAGWIFSLVTAELWLRVTRANPAEPSVLPSIESTFPS